MKPLQLIAVVFMIVVALLMGGYMVTAERFSPIPANAPFCGCVIYAGQSRLGDYVVQAGWFQWQKELTAKRGYEFKTEDGRVMKRIKAAHPGVRYQILRNGRFVAHLIIG